MNHPVPCPSLLSLFPTTIPVCYRFPPLHASLSEPPASLENRMPPTRTSPGTSPYRPPSLSSIPFKFRRKSLSADDLPHPDAFLVPSPSLSPSLSMSMSSSPPSSPTALCTSPSRPSHLDTTYVRQPSSPIRPTAHHAYGYAYRYPRGASNTLGYEPDLLSAEHMPKSFPARSHAYAVIPSARATSSTYSSLSPSDTDGNLHFSSSASESAFPHGMSPSPSLFRCGRLHQYAASVIHCEAERTAQTLALDRTFASQPREFLRLLIQHPSPVNALCLVAQYLARVIGSDQLMTIPAQRPPTR